MIKSPTEKQLEFIEDIMNVLKIEFPQSSKEFDRKICANFIKTHYEEFMDAINYDPLDEDDDMAWFQMLNG